MNKRYASEQCTHVTIDMTFKMTRYHSICGWMKKIWIDYR